MNTSVELYNSLAITLTLKSKVLILKNVNQYKRSVVEINNILVNHKDDFRFEYLVPELTKNNCIHYHGVVKVINTIKFPKTYVLEAFRRSPIIGFICIKPIEDYHKWLEYCQKSQGEEIKYIMSRCFLHVWQDEIKEETEETEDNDEYATITTIIERIKQNDNKMEQIEQQIEEFK